MTTLDERYPDLLGHGDDPELARLVADLDKAYAASTPPPHLRVSLQRTLHERMSALHVPRQTAPARSLRLLSWPRRPILAAVALLAAVVMAGAAYAYISLVDQAYSQTSGLLPVMQKY